MLRTSFVFVSLAAALLSLTPRDAHASAVDVSPVLVELSDKLPSTTVVVSNHSDKVVRFHITAFAWQQREDGEMMLEPTSDIVFFPAMLALNPKGMRQVRVGTKVKPGAVERTYRMFVEELPPLASELEPGTVSMLMKMSLPVFVKAQKPKATPVLTPLVVAGRELKFSVKNTGNSHTRARKLLLVAKAADGTTVESQDLKGWYVLAGGTRTYTVALSDAVCQKAAALEVQLESADGSPKASLSGFRCGS